MAFTAGNAKIQAIESKHVINRELWAALQFPIGDDVSALHPLRSSATLCLEYGGIHFTDTSQDTVYQSAKRSEHCPVFRISYGLDWRHDGVRVDYCPLDCRPSNPGMG